MIFLRFSDIVSVRFPASPSPAISPLPPADMERFYYKLLYGKHLTAPDPSAPCILHRGIEIDRNPGQVFKFHKLGIFILLCLYTEHQVFRPDSKFAPKYNPGSSEVIIPPQTPHYPDVQALRASGLRSDAHGRCPGS